MSIEIATLECKLTPEIAGTFLITGYIFFFSVYTFLLLWRRGEGEVLDEIVFDDRGGAS